MDRYSSMVIHSFSSIRRNIFRTTISWITIAFILTLAGCTVARPIRLLCFPVLIEDVRALYCAPPQEFLQPSLTPDEET